MEHRWGKRCSVDLPVRLQLRDSCIEGRARELSLSGVYVVTAAKVRVGQSLSVEFAASGGEQPPVAAWVIREDATGLALEWQEFAAWPIVLMLEAATSLAGADGLPDPVSSPADRGRPAYATACRRGH